ncbi:MAG: aminomethyl transferase family protein [Desulfosalsimonadaceae bacterium]
MAQEPKQTPLFGRHRQLGANLSVFGGYSMPLWYPSGAKTEHLAVIRRAGLFDTSHMAAIRITGPQSLDLLQQCCTRDLERCFGKKKRPLAPGTAAYGAYLNEAGCVLDDTLIYQLGPLDYLSVVNAGQGGALSGHLSKAGGSSKVSVTDLTDKLGKLDLQGPASVAVLMETLENGREVLSSLSYFSFKADPEIFSGSGTSVRLRDNTPLMLSRSGYTGEIGFELFLRPEDLVTTWDLLLAAGESRGLIPCGLAARDSLRTGAVLPLSHQDIGDWPFINHPWHVALPFTPDGTDFTKNFIGSRALLELEQPYYTSPFAGYDLRKITVSETAAPEVLDAAEQPVGTVLTCVTDMAIGRWEDGTIYSISSPGRPQDFQPRGLCCGFVRLERPPEAGEIVYLNDGRRKIKAELTRNIRPDRSAGRNINTMIEELS